MYTSNRIQKKSKKKKTCNFVAEAGAVRALYVCAKETGV